MSTGVEGPFLGEPGFMKLAVLACPPGRQSDSNKWTSCSECSLRSQVAASPAVPLPTTATFIVGVAEEGRGGARTAAIWSSAHGPFLLRKDEMNLLGLFDSFLLVNTTQGTLFQRLFCKYLQ